MHEFIDEDAGAFEQANHELKRVDHLIYVSLKYTRTVDVIKNIIARLIATYDFIWDDFLMRLERERAIFEIPAAPGLKCSTIKKHYNDAKVKEFIEFYLLLRQFNNANYTALKEFRRHVAMKAQFPNGEYKEINIDIITDYYKKTREFLDFVKETYFKELH
ncbi:MAG TPA: hypothetical protein VK158_01175 [Acidobacteriota bacterium]|nr:hypothetical protein [Acidobacteriota bacterium]